jgi:hypothetical protein
VIDVATTERATTTTPTAAPSLSELLQADDTTPLPIGLFAAALCLAIGLAHVQDQGSFLGNESPGTFSLIVEGALFLLSVQRLAAFASRRRRA